MLRKTTLAEIIFISFFIFKCNMQNPAVPENFAHVKINLIFKDSHPPESFSWNNINGMSKNASYSTLAKQNVPEKMILTDMIKVVFYSVNLKACEEHVEYEEYIDINEYFDGLEGDRSDFNGYWLRGDKGWLDRVAPGKHRIERAADINVINQSAQGVFELTEGTKVCRVGLFEGGRLTHVGLSSVYYSPFFNVCASDTNEINIILSAVHLNISGYIQTPNGAGIEGVTVTFSNNGGTALTDEEGYYRAILPYRWSGTAEPSLLDYSFEPEARNYMEITYNQTEQNYIGYDEF